MAYEFFVVMQKRGDGKVYADLRKTDERMYPIESEADDALAKVEYNKTRPYKHGKAF